MYIYFNPQFIAVQQKSVSRRLTYKLRLIIDLEDVDRSAGMPGAALASYRSQMKKRDPGGAMGAPSIPSKQVGF
jgi:hypothetical protein